MFLSSEKYNTKYFHILSHNIHKISLETIFVKCSLCLLKSGMTRTIAVFPIRSKSIPLGFLSNSTLFSLPKISTVVCLMSHLSSKACSY